MKIIYKIILVYVFFTSIKLFGISSYPDWFLFQENYPNTIVGYSYGGYTAVIDAERNYCVYNNCVANGILYRFQNYDKKNSEYFYYFSPDSLKKIKDQLYVMSSFLTNVINSEYIKLFSKDKTNDIVLKFVNLKNSSMPKWVKKKPFFQDGNYYYGVGEYQSRANENDAWKTAEEQAIFAIMTNLAINFYSVNILNVDENGDNYEEATAIKVKYKFDNIQIQRRWVDLNKHYYYVLVRIKKSDVYSPFMN
ncbi:MAG: hypothetical protein U9R41_06120 [Candidatus Marinimicrobia bacterium]|nr:hypothetical protein [Candidatus Neomarinimicrobiota bacterium]